MKLRIFIIFAAALFSNTCFSQETIETAVKKLLSKPEYKNASVGMQFKDLETGTSFFSLNPNQLMIPGSILKLITSGAALEMLGADYRFETKIGFTGSISNTILNGDIVVIAGGDPALGSEYFEEKYFNPDFLKTWINNIELAGIHQVQGDLVIDISLYDSERIPPTWVWEDLGNYYGAGSGALSVYDNLFKITFRSPEKTGQPTEIINVHPNVPGMIFKNEVLSSALNYDRANVFGGPFGTYRIVRGTIPKNREAFSIKASLPFPEKLLAEEFQQRLADAGIFFSGNIRFGKIEPVNFHPLYIQKSPTLAEIVKVLNHESVNLFAEQLVKQLAAEYNGIGNRHDGIVLIKKFWETKGMIAGSYFMEDGSGLSPFNAVSPELFTEVLHYMATESLQKTAFINSLAEAGQGTLVFFDPEVFPGNTLKAKSGSMTRVRCYAGFLKLRSGKKAVFCIMFNHFSGSQYKLVDEIENLLHRINSTL